MKKRRYEPKSKNGPVLHEPYNNGGRKSCDKEIELLVRYHKCGKLYEVKNPSSSYAPRRFAALLEQAQKNDINQHSYM